MRSKQLPQNLVTEKKVSLREAASSLGLSSQACFLKTHTDQSGPEGRANPQESDPSNTFKRLPKGYRL
jgi:hypothetical protein